MSSESRRPRISFYDEQNNQVADDESAIVEVEGRPRDATPDVTRSSSDYQRRRRSSLGQRWNSFTQMGGPNSLDNFARSFQRVAGSRDIVQSRRRSVFIETLSSSDEGEDEIEGLYQGSPVPSSTRQRQRSLLSEQLSASHQRASSPLLPSEEPTESTTLFPPTSDQPLSSSLPESRQRIRERASIVDYGGVSSLLTPNAKRRASILADEQYQTALWARKYAKEDTREIRQRRIEVESNDAGEIITRIVGASTVPMTVFNMTNSLVGIGMISLPLALSYTGWVVGLLLFTALAFATFYTAILLTRCLETNSASMTYSDIAYLAFGSTGRRCVECLFFLELIVAGTGLIILFGDSMSQLIPSVNTLTWKIIVAIGLLPLNFAPFKYLSLTSVLGIFCTIGLILMVFTDGMIKPSQPGSLRQLATTDVWPRNIRAIPLSIGLFSSPWGGHPIVPGVFRDMRHPAEFPKAARTSYISAYILDISMAIIGYLMFGDKVKAEVTAGDLQSRAYPAVVTLLIILFIALVSTTKLPLATRPLIDTIASKFETDKDSAEHDDSSPITPTNKAQTGRIVAAIGVNLVELAIAISFPSFDSIMVVLGSAFCLTICIILPVSFYLRIFSAEARGITTLERTFCGILIFVAFVLAVLGTTYAIVPRGKLGV